MKDGELQRSHMIPRAVYRTLRATGNENRHPVCISNGRARTTSRQLQRHLLCRLCEDRFNKRGERWTLAQAFQPDGTFPLETTISRSNPVFTTATDRIYRGVREFDQAVYFGASVFWRAAVADWKFGSRDTIRISLGPHEDDLRRYLLDEGPFPEHMAMLIRLWRLHGVESLMRLPQSRRDHGYHVHDFAMPGLEFALLVGKLIPPDWKTFCSARTGCLLVSPELDVRMIRSAAQSLRESDTHLRMSGPGRRAGK